MKEEVKINGEVFYNMCLNEDYKVVQSNSLVTGKQVLKTNSAKILRAAIMQIKNGDEEMKPYILSISDLAKLLRVDKENIYRLAHNVSKELMMCQAFIRTEYKKKSRQKFKSFNVVSYCEYDSEIGFAIKLNQDMKPYLLGMKSNFTQYTLQNILTMKSVYGIRIFELLMESIKINGELAKDRALKKGVYKTMNIQYIRECCNCEEKYQRFSQFKSRVVDRAVEEINRATEYTVTYDCIKTGKAITDIEFFIKKER